MMKGLNDDDGENILLGNVLSNAAAACDRMVRGAAGCTS